MGESEHAENERNRSTPVRQSGDDRLRRAIRRIHVMGPRAPDAQGRRVALLEILNDRCSIEDLRTLCFYLGIDYDTVPGDRKRAKARELIAHFDRRDNLDALIFQLRRIRPDLEVNP